MPEPKVKTKKYVSPSKSQRTLRKKKEKPKDPGADKTRETNYLRMLQLLSAPTTRQGGSTVDAAFAGAARGLAIAQLLGSLSGEKTPGKVGAAPLETVKPKAGGASGVPKTSDFKPQTFGGGMV